MARTTVRQGMASVRLEKAQFFERLRQRFQYIASGPLQAEADKIVDAAWDGYDNSRKATDTLPPDRATPTGSPRLRSTGWRNAMRSSRSSGGRSLRRRHRASC